MPNGNGGLPGSPAEPGQALSSQRVLIIMGGLLLGMFLAALDQTIVSTALPTIVGRPRRPAHLSWVVTAVPAGFHGLDAAVGQARRPVRAEERSSRPRS